jgi:phage-related tail protein
MWEKRHAAVVRERDSLYAKWEGADDHRIRMKEAAKESEAFTRNLQGQVGRISAICEKQKGALNAMAADIADQARHVLDLQARLDRRENKVKKLKAKLRKAKGSK